MDSRQRTARFAGLLYLLVVFTGLFSLVYVPSKIFVPGNASATVANIIKFQSLYTINIANGVISTLLFLAVALVLYRLLKEVNPTQAALMVILILVQIPMELMDQYHQVAALVLARGADFLAPFSTSQREALAMLFLEISDKGVPVVEILWGLWLIPLGLLVFKSGFLPRFLGVWLVLCGWAYVILSLAGILVPQYVDVMKRVAFPVIIAEVALMLWLLIMGAKPLPKPVST